MRCVPLARTIMALLLVSYAAALMAQPCPIQSADERSLERCFDLAPSPGFTQQQLARLALLYVAASYRSRKWLLPAYHAAVDTTLAGAHNDPQNFDASAWLSSLRALQRTVALVADAMTAHRDEDADTQPEETE